MAEANPGNSQHEHRLLLVNLSNQLEYRNVCLDQLKFALSDFVLTRRNLDNAKKALDLFIELDNAGYIKPDDVKLLIALFKLLWLDALNDILLKPKFPIEDVDPKDVFSSFRISIVNLSNKLLDDDTKKIGYAFAVPLEECSNPWKLLQILQDKGELHKGNLTDFVKNYRINKDFLEWYPSNMPPVATESVVITVEHRPSEVSDTSEPHSDLPRLEDDPQNGLHYLSHINSLIERVKCIIDNIANLFPFDLFCRRIEKSSIVFHVSSYDPKALKNLRTMCLNGQLLNKLSEILVVEEYKEQFLDEWKVIINEDQFNVAVSKLETAIGSTSMESALGPRFASPRSSKTSLGPRFASPRSSKTSLGPRFPSSKSSKSAFSSVSTSSQTSAKFTSKVSALLSRFTSRSISGRSKSKKSDYVVVQKMALISEGQNPIEVDLTDYVVVQKMALISEGQNPIEVDLTGNLTLIKEKPFVIKEGAAYQIRVKFLVKGTMVKGLGYKQVISRMGIKAHKSVFEFGNFKPKAEPYNYVTTMLEAPKGRWGRGHYKVKSKIFDNNEIVYLKWKWILHVKEE